MKERTAAIGISLAVAFLVLASGSLNGLFVTQVTGSILSPINTNVDLQILPGGNGYGYSINGTLTVVKDVMGINRSASSFTMVVYNDTSTGNDTFMTSFPGSSTGTKVTLHGSYDVSEILNSSFNTTFSSGCYGALSEGENATCYVTNHFKGFGHLTVIKKVKGGPVGSSAFTMVVLNNTIANNGLTRYSFPGSKNGTTVSFLGTYDVHETSNTVATTGYDDFNNYTSSFSPGCYGTLTAGKNTTCIVVNKFIKPKDVGFLKVVKKVVGGSLGASNFTLSVLNDSKHSGKDVLLTTFSGSKTGTNVTVLGKYDVTEKPVKGYTTTFSGDCYGVITPDQHETCTVTNKLKTDHKEK